MNLCDDRYLDDGWSIACVYDKQRTIIPLQNLMILIKSFCFMLFSPQSAHTSLLEHRIF